MVNTVLFDGESALRSKQNKKLIQEKLNINVIADPAYKRNFAERYVREYKVRTAVLLENKKLSLNQWRNYISDVVNVINNTKPKSSINQILTDYFSKEITVFPQQNLNFFKFNINDKVKIDLTKKQRNDLSFKWTLNRGNKFYYNEQKH